MDKTLTHADIDELVKKVEELGALTDNERAKLQAIGELAKRVIAKEPGLGSSLPKVSLPNLTQAFNVAFKTAPRRTHRLTPRVK